MRALCFILKRMWVSGNTPAMNVLTEGIREVGVDVFHRDLLPRYVDSFSQLQDRSLPFSDDARDPNQFIQALGWLGRHEDEWAEWLPVALETVVRTYDDERGRFALLKAWERSCYLMRLNDVNEVNRRITAGAVLDDLKRGVGEALGGRLVPPAKAVTDAKGRLRGRLWPATLRAAITKRAEMAVCEALGQPLSPDVDKATAEHVLPKHPAPRTQWHKDFPSKAAIADSLDLLGNAALLTRSVDGRIGNKDFDAKKSEYRKYKTNTKFQLTKQVIGKSKWTRDEIRARTDELAKTLEKAWGI
jgi:hypothetical protein